MTDSGQQLASLITELEQHELELCFDRFTNEDAWRLGVSLVELGRSRELPITIDIRRYGQQLFHAALSGTTPENDSWIERKARVVERFSASSYLVGRRLTAKGTHWTRRTASTPRSSPPTVGAFRSGSGTWEWLVA